MSTMSCLSRGEIVALGWTLLHFCWQGTAGAGVALLNDRSSAVLGLPMEELEAVLSHEFGHIRRGTICAICCRQP
jgi:hypothetical protein